jgi:hypothetical protein
VPPEDVNVEPESFTGKSLGICVAVELGKTLPLSGDIWAGSMLVMPDCRNALPVGL